MVFQFPGEDSLNKMDSASSEGDEVSFPPIRIFQWFSIWIPESRWGIAVKIQRRNKG
jgi:hypothetical protein